MYLSNRQAFPPSLHFTSSKASNTQQTTHCDDRQELPLNINPQLTFKDDPTKTTAASRTAALIYSSCRFYKTLNDSKLEPDMFHTQVTNPSLVLLGRMNASSLTFHLTDELHTQACMGGTGTGFFKFLNGKGGSDQFNTVCSMLPKQYSFYGAYLYGTYPLDMSQYNGTHSPPATKAHAR